MNALYRLLGRRAVLLWALLIGVMAGLDPLLDHRPGEWLTRLADGSLLPGELRTLWLSLFLLATLTGLLVSRVQKELQHELFAWTLPGLRGRLFTGVMPILAAVVLAFTLAGFRVEGAPTALSFAALGLLLFTAPTAFWDPVPSALVSRGVLAVLTVALFRAPELFEAAEVAPLPMTALGLISGAVFLWRDYSARAARARPFVPTWPLGTSGEGRWMQEVMAHAPPSPRAWRRRPDPNRVIDWVLAAEYEIFGRYRWGWPGWTFTIAAVTVATAWAWTDDRRELVTWCAVAAMVHHVIGSSFLRRKVPHPLSRTQRARVAWWSCLLNNAAFCGVFALLLLGAVHLLPASPFGGQLHAVERPLSFLPFLFALMPVLQGFQGLWLMGEGAGAHGGSFVGVFGLFALIALLGAGIVIPALLLDGWTALGTAVVAAVVIQAGFRVVLDRFYRTADLV